MKGKVMALERENRRLKQELQNLSTPEGIERLARERLGLVRPEEIVVVPLASGTTLSFGTDTCPLPTAPGGR